MNTTFASSDVTVVVMSTLCGVDPVVSYTSANTDSSSFSGNARNATGGAGSTTFNCSSGLVVMMREAPAIEVSARPLTLNGAL